MQDEPDAFEAMLRTFTKKNAFKTRHKLKAHTSKIVSSFKPPALVAMQVKDYKVRKSRGYLGKYNNFLPKKYFFPNSKICSLLGKVRNIILVHKFNFSSHFNGNIVLPKFDLMIEI